MLPTLRALRAPASVVARQPWTNPSRSMSTSLINDLIDTVNDTLPPTPSKGYPPPRKTSLKARPTEFKGTQLRLHCHTSSNNTIATLTKADGSTIAWFSGGSCGFKKGNRSSYEAGYQCAARIFKKVEEINATDGRVRVDVFLKGFGQGREALKAALLATEGDEIRPLVQSITDRTPIKIGGTRAKKARRI